MRIYQESGFSFDFRAALHSVVHDKAEPFGDGNAFWPAIDFRVVESDYEVWIEVKSWSFKAILDRVARRSAKKDFESKLLKKGADEFRNDIVGKFLGTTSYLAWSGHKLPASVCYVVFLEPPDRGTRPLLGPFQDRLRDEFKNAQGRAWGKRIQYWVVDLSGFNKDFPQYPVTRI